MEQLQSLNSIKIYGNKKLLKSNIRKSIKILHRILKDHKLKLNTIEINLITDDELLGINQSALNHDYYTDIITFDYTNNKIVTGDIYISIDRVTENALTYKNSAFQELLRVMCHGVLHLSGYADKTKQEKTTMTKMENKYLGIYKQTNSSTGNK